MLIMIMQTALKFQSAKQVKVAMWQKTFCHNDDTGQGPVILHHLDELTSVTGSASLMLDISNMQIAEHVAGEKCLLFSLGSCFRCKQMLIYFFT